MQVFALGLDISAESLLAFAVQISHKTSVKFFQNGNFQRINFAVLNQLTITQFSDFIVDVIFIFRFKFRHSFNINVNRIQVQATDRAIRTGFFRVSMHQNVQRVQADDICAAVGADFDKISQIGKVTDTPVTLTAQRIKLQRIAPDFAIFQGLVFITAPRRYRQSTLVTFIADFKCQVIIADRQIASHRHQKLYINRFADGISFIRRMNIKSHIRANARIFIFNLQSKKTLCLIGRNDCVKMQFSLFDNINIFQSLLPAALVKISQGFFDFSTIACLISQTFGNKADNALTDFIVFLRHSGIAEFSDDTKFVRQFLQHFFHIYAPYFLIS